MQFGFVIDHSRCIGCHACTVACKAENDVPVGSFRTWVKYTERGTFPEVRRSFAVLRCNQCTDAPCVTICPVRALDKRPDGIVDVDPRACIGCKACMQACPYDALYISDRTGTAEKCHFCAHRVERGLAPACAVVCPTEAIVPGDFDDPHSHVSRLRRDDELAVRKPEAGTLPNVYYREAGPAGIDPSLTDAANGYLWANRLPGMPLDAEQFLAADAASREQSRARTTYDVDHAPLWGRKVSGYLFTKSIAAGLALVLGLLVPRSNTPTTTLGELAVLALGFLLITTVLLVGDLKRPERFFKILLRPNWSSWLARGSIVLMAQGALLTPLAAWSLWGVPAGVPMKSIAVASAAVAVLTAGYTGWLFTQAKGRVLWMRRGLWLHLVIQAAAAGPAIVLVLLPVLELAESDVVALRWMLLVALVLHAAFVLAEPRLAPAQREAEYHRASRMLTHGPFIAVQYAFGLGLGVAVPAVAVVVAAFPVVWSGAGIFALAGLWIQEDVLVRAGQAPPIS